MTDPLLRIKRPSLITDIIKRQPRDTKERDVRKMSDDAILEPMIMQNKRPMRFHQSSETRVGPNFSKHITPSASDPLPKPGKVQPLMRESYAMNRSEVNSNVTPEHQ